MRIVQSDKIPTPKGHYSPAIEHNGILYISGQLPVEPETGRIGETIEEQTTQVLKNLKLILEESGSTLNQVVQVRIYISNVQLWGKVNEVYADFFGVHKPVRCVVPTRELHYGALIEVEATAILDKETTVLSI